MGDGHLESSIMKQMIAWQKNRNSVASSNPLWHKKVSKNIIQRLYKSLPTRVDYRAAISKLNKGKEK